MGKSTKKAIIKDVGHRKKEYWGVHRTTNKKILKTAIVNGETDINFKNPKEIVNDYDYSDYTLDYEYTTNSTNTDKLRRK